MSEVMMKRCDHEYLDERGCGNLAKTVCEQCKKDLCKLHEHSIKVHIEILGANYESISISLCGKCFADWRKEMKPDRCEQILVETREKIIDDLASVNEVFK